nr:DNA internalization-related competence protein ComEC/Rec2 [Vagococcus elongatus]
MCIIYIQPYLKLFPVLWQQKLMFSLLLTICSLPLTSFHFYEWNILSLVFSFVLLPLFQWGLLPVLILCVFSSFLFPDIFLVRWFEELLETFHQLLLFMGDWRFTQMTTGTYSLLLLGILLFLLGGALYHFPENSKKSWRLVLILLFVLGGQKYMKIDGLIVFVDVGQGDSVVIQEPFHGKTVVIDTGGRLNFSVEKWQEKEINNAGAEYTLIPFLKSRGISQIDVFFASHGDEDHIGDLAELAEEIPIHTIVFGKGLEKNDSFLLEVKELKKITRLVPALGPQQLSIGNVAIDLLYPQESGDGGNNHSLVMRAVIKDRSFLFTGDLEAEGERELMEDFPKLQADVLKVAHHGSRTSSTPEFIAALNPQTAIISCGRDNRFGHPHEEVVGTLAENEIDIFRTDQSGMVYYQWYPWDGSLTKIKKVNSKSEL